MFATAPHHTKLTLSQGGGGLVHQLKKSYSLTDLSSTASAMDQDEVDLGGGSRTRAISYSTPEDEQSCKSISFGLWHSSICSPKTSDNPRRRRSLEEASDDERMMMPQQQLRKRQQQQPYPRKG